MTSAITAKISIVVGIHGTTACNLGIVLHSTDVLSCVSGPPEGGQAPRLRGHAVSREVLRMQRKSSQVLNALRILRPRVYLAGVIIVPVAVQQHLRSMIPVLD